MRISDWSSDVCSSDLGDGWAYRAKLPTFAKGTADADKQGEFLRKIYVRNKVVLQQLSHNGGSLRMKLGYARVSTEDQNLDIQWARLSEAGCEIDRKSTRLNSSH